MTNLFAATVISLSTNVTVEDNRPTKWIQEPCSSQINAVAHLVNCNALHGRWEKYGEATERTEFEVVTRVRTLRFHFEGVPYDVPVKEHQPVIAHRVRVLHREIQWKLVEDFPTNALRFALAPMLTNRVETNIPGSSLRSLIITNNNGLWGIAP